MRVKPFIGKFGISVGALRPAYHSTGQSVHIVWYFGILLCIFERDSLVRTPPTRRREPCGLRRSAFLEDSLSSGTGKHSGDQSFLEALAFEPRVNATWPDGISSHMPKGS